MTDTAKKQSKPKQEKEAKPKKVKKPSLILNKSIHIPAFKDFADKKAHIVKGGTYLPGTVVTKDMIKAYNAAKARVGGETPIEAFCE